ncbi:hypothetical protein Plhal710r2_c068g0176851 [Plasmopara halstedii]
MIDGLAAGTYHVRFAANNMTRPPLAPRSLCVKAKMIDYSHGMLVVWTALRSDDSNTDQYRIQWDSAAVFTSHCGDNIETQMLVVTNSLANVANKKLIVQTTDGSTKISCVDPVNLASSLQMPLRALGGVYSGRIATIQGDDSATYDYGRTNTVKFPQGAAVPT